MERDGRRREKVERDRGEERHEGEGVSSNREWEAWKMMRGNQRERPKQESDNSYKFIYIGDMMTQR